MNLLARGGGTLVTEVSHVSPYGVWLLTSGGKELFMAYEDFPWFKEQPVGAIYNVEEPRKGHFYWPDMDVDLSEEIIENPSRFPRVAGARG